MLAVGSAVGTGVAVAVAVICTCVGVGAEVCWTQPARANATKAIIAKPIVNFIPNPPVLKIVLTGFNNWRENKAFCFKQKEKPLDSSLPSGVLLLAPFEREKDYGEKGDYRNCDPTPGYFLLFGGYFDGLGFG